MKITSDKKGAFGFGALIQITRDFFKTHPSNLRRWLAIFRPFGFAQDQDRFDDWNYHLYFISQKFLSKRWCSKVHGEDASCVWHYYKPFTIRAHYCQTIGQDREYPEYEITKHTFLERKYKQRIVNESAYHKGGQKN